MARHLWALAALIVLTAIGYFHFPGHTYLQSDTQIYVPILERLYNPTLFHDEIIAQRPHVSFTMYDEAAIFLRRLTSWPFRDVLALQQIAFRFCALLGVYLLALSLGLGRSGSVLVAACFGLGASINGPAVLTFEYEPVPRGNAIGLTMLAFGLLAHGRHLAAGCAAAAAFLYHVPAVYPYWAAFFVLSLIPSWPERMRRHITGLAPMALGVVLLLVLSQTQTGEGEHQVFFSRIDSAYEEMLRQRASYNWVSLWPPSNYFHHLILYTCLLAAIRRLWSRMAPDSRLMVLFVTAIGMLSIPLSYFLLEQMKWSLLTQFQPMRAVLYVTAFAVILSAAAGVAAAQQRRWAECAAWFLIALLPPATTRTIPTLLEAPNRGALLSMFVSAALVTAVLWLASKWRPAIVLAFFSLPFVIPAVSGVRNYPPLHHKELDDLARWARQSTTPSDIFLFPDAERSLHPGVFRAESLRTVYVDWKGGGQINFLRDFLTLWVPRWKILMEPKFQPAQLQTYPRYGIHYVVLAKRNAIAGRTAVYSNPRYTVYRLPD